MDLWEAVIIIVIAAIFVVAALNSTQPEQNSEVHSYFNSSTGTHVYSVNISDSVSYMGN
jgi:hypothetical protein